MISKITDAIWSYQHSKVEVETEHAPFRIEQPDYLFRRFPKDTKSLLDVGIGNGWLGNLARLYHPGIEVVDGVEAYEDSVRKAQKYYNHIYNDTIENVLKDMPSKKYDVVTCINTIEHFEKPLEVLEGFERVAKKAVFIITVNFYFQQAEYAGNKWQRHLSVIPSTVLKKRGYTVRPNGKLVETFGVVAKLFPRLDSQYIGWKYL